VHKKVYSFDSTPRLILPPAMYVIKCLHDPANVQQTFSKCIQDTRKLLDVCRIV